MVFRLDGDVDLLAKICWIWYDSNVPPGVELELRVAQLRNDFHALLRRPVVQREGILRQDTDLSLPGLHAS